MPSNVLYKKLIESELGYIAGMVDGEGFISIHTDEKNITRCYVTITSTNKTVIDWLGKKLGGTIHKRVHKNPKWLDYYVWKVSGNIQVKEFLLTIEPYLIIKKQRARQALAVKTRFSPAIILSTPLAQ